MRHENSAAFILTHGRPARVLTYNTLRRFGWTRPIYLIVDDEDETVPEYRARYGEQVIQFSKAAIEPHIDTADSLTDRRSPLYARNASHAIANELGLDYYWQLDDDYSDFRWRYEEDGHLVSHPVRRLDDVFDALAGFLDSGNTTCVAMSQSGDAIGGLAGWKKRPLRRKAMNSFIIRRDRQFPFVGRLNDDVNTYVSHGGRGHLFWTIMQVRLHQMPTQQHDGGITELYKALGTYAKSFYTVMMAPSSVTIRTIGPASPRMHHFIDSEKAYPKLISDRYRKPDRTEAA